MQNKKILILLTTISVLTMVSCANVPNNIKSGNRAEVVTKDSFVSAQNMLDDLDEAFETKYTKFKLPDKSDVKMNKPKEIYNVKLDYVNSKANFDWTKEKLYALNDIFNVTDAKLNKNDIGYSLTSD